MKRLPLDFDFTQKSILEIKKLFERSLLLFALVDSGPKSAFLHPLGFLQSFLFFDLFFFLLLVLGAVLYYRWRSSSMGFGL